MFKTYEEIKNSILNEINEVDKREGSFTNDMISPIALEVEASHEAMKGILSKRFLVNETGDDLDKRADEYGLKRKPGFKASGFIAIFGVSGSGISAGSLFGSTEGLLFETVNDSVIIDSNAIIEIKALEIGDQYNLSANKITEIPIAISGVASCTNPNDITGGSNTESDEDLQNRLLMRIRNPSTSGNPAHYKEWALEVPGIGDAKVIPLKDGNGTVTVIPVTNDKRTPNLTLIEAVSDNIEIRRPVGANVTVLEAVEVQINCEAQLVIDSSVTLSEITENYLSKLSDYIRSSVFKISNVDYFKCLSLFYEISGVLQVTSFLLNGTSLNVLIGETEIQVVGSIEIS